MRKALVLSTLLAALLAGTARAAVPCDPSPVAGFACTVSDPEGDVSERMRLDIVSVTAEFGTSMVSFSVEASKAFGPRAIGYRANPDNPDGEFELHFLAETIKDHPGREAKLVVGYNSDYGRYWVRVFDLTTGEYASAPGDYFVLRPTPSMLTVVVPRLALPHPRTHFGMYFVARYIRFDLDQGSVAEVERAPDHQRAGPAGPPD